MTDESYEHVHEFKCTGCDASGPRLERRPEPFLAGAGAQVTEALEKAAYTLTGHRLVDADRPAKWRGEDLAYNLGIEHCTDWLLRWAREDRSESLPHMGTGQSEADLTPAEIARLAQSVETDEGTGDIRAVVYAVESLLAAHMAGQAEATAEASDELARTITVVDELAKRYDAALAELADLRARIRALADEWTKPIANWLRSSYNVQDDSPTAEDVSNERLAAAQRMTQMRDQLSALLDRPAAAETKGET